jgi:hypothetical protein
MMNIIKSNKQAKFRWLQDPSEINRDNLKCIKLGGSRHFRNKKREGLKGKINELATISKNRNIRETQ